MEGLDACAGSMTCILAAGALRRHPRGRTRRRVLDLPARRCGTPQGCVWHKPDLLWLALADEPVRNDCCACRRPDDASLAVLTDLELHFARRPIEPATRSSLHCFELHRP